MKELLPYFERELEFVRSGLRQFGNEFPATASALRFIGETSSDPHVEQLIQASALLSARTAKQLDDGYLRFTNALLEAVQPLAVRPIPSVSIAQIMSDRPGARPVRGVTVLPKGTRLKSAAQAGVVCRFRTTSDLSVTPITISRAGFSQVIDAPPCVKPPSGIGGKITVDFDSNDGTFDTLASDKLRIYLGGEPSLVAAIRDAFFLNLGATFFEVDNSGYWQELRASPVLPVGFDPTDALLPHRHGDQPACRLLTEYFLFLEKFNFVDIDLAAVRTRCAEPVRRISLHLLLTLGGADSERVRLLSALARDNFLLGCVPVINLFPHPAKPIQKTDTHSEYVLVPDQVAAHACDIYSIDRVQLLPHAQAKGHPIEMLPLHACRSGYSRKHGQPFWLARRDDDATLAHRGNDWRISFVDADLDPSRAEAGSVSAMLTCTNRDLPASLTWGARDGDLVSESSACSFPIRLLRKPTTYRRLAMQRHAHWQVISHLALSQRTLLDDDGAALRDMLRLYATAEAAAAARQIDGIVAIACEPSTTRLRHRWGNSYLHGTAIRITLDEEAYAGTSLHAFIELLDYVFGLHVHLNSFTQLIALSKQTGKELMRCLPRNGMLSLV